MISLYDEFKNYSDQGFYPCHMPGHKRHAFGYLPFDYSSIDFTEVEGLDDLHDPSGIIHEAQKYAAAQLGADETYFLVNGSTAGILAAVSACTDKGGKLILSRNCHRSAYNAMYLRDLSPAYVFPKLSGSPAITDVVTAEEVRRVLDENPDAQAVLIVSPTYEGRLADIRQIAAAVHEKGIPLIVDEAHGAHLSFTERSRADAIRCGADIAVQSLHKTLPAPTQTSVISVKGDLVCREKLRRFQSIYQSSSPSYPLMSMIDGCIRFMAEKRELVPRFHDNFENLLKRLEVCDKLVFRPSASELHSQTADYGKLLICTEKTGVSGVKAAALLREKYKVETEMACPGFVLAMFTVCDDEEGFDRVAKALISLDKDHQGDEASSGFLLSERDLPMPALRMKPSEAMDLQAEYVTAGESEGRICSGMISMYPPGTPLIAPGEEITGKHLDFIVRCMDEGYNIKGIGNKGIPVVKNG